MYNPFCSEISEVKKASLRTRHNSFGTPVNSGGERLGQRSNVLLKNIVFGGSVGEGNFGMLDTFIVRI